MKSVALNPIRIAVLSTAAALAPLTLVAQDPMIPPASGNLPNQQQQSPAMQDSSGAPGMTAQMIRDKMFLRKAVAGGLAEVQLGLLAVQKAESPEVKDFGQKMVTDHNALNEDLRPVADSLGVMLPKKISKEDQAEHDKLSGLSGSDFDTEYLTFMVKDHHQDLREFREEVANTSEPLLKDAVTKGAAVIREHTKMVDQLARARGIQVPVRKPSAGPGQ
jgi:putative membrane protein